MSLVFLSIGALGAIDVFQRKSFFDSSERTKGVVSEFHCPSIKRSTCSVVIEANVRGQRLKVSAEENSTPTFKFGTTAEIAYSVNSLGQVDARLVQSIFRGQNIVPLVLGSGGFLISAFATYLFFITSPQWRKYRRRVARRQRNAV